MEQIVPVTIKHREAVITTTTGRVLLSLSEEQAREIDNLHFEQTASLEEVYRKNCEALLKAGIEIAALPTVSKPIKERSLYATVKKNFFFKRRAGQEFTVYDQCMKNRSGR